MNTSTNITRTPLRRRRTRTSPLAQLLTGGLSSLLLSLLVVTVAVLMASGMVLAQQTTSTVPSYTVKDLGTLPGRTESVAFDINDTGQVVGYSGTITSSQEDAHAFLYSGGQMQDLGTLDSTYNYSVARGINASGQVVGSSKISSGEYRAFLYSGGQMKDLGTLRFLNSGASAINDSGQVVGTAGGLTSGHTSLTRAFLYSGDQMQDLGTLPGHTDSGASDINDTGQIVGYSGNSTFPRNNHAFLYSGGQMQDLGTLPGHTDSGALAINNTGQIVGGSGNSGLLTDNHAFLYSGGQMQDLGTLPGGIGSVAYSVNDSGQVVGVSLTSNETKRAFLYSDAQMYDLNNLIPANSGWTLLEAQGINTSGQIVGTGVINGQTRAFLATPTTTPPDAIPPKVISTSPKANATGVAPTANVKATFSEEMDSTTINATTFTLFKKGTTTQIAAQVSYNADTDTAKLDPTNNLRRGVAYKAVVSTGVKDVAGNRLDQDGSTSGFQQMRWFFRVDD